MIRKGVTAELWWFLIFLSPFAVIGAAFDQVFAALTCGLVLYTGRLLYYLNKLESWIIDARRESPKPHEMVGVWGEIAEDVLLLSQRMDKDKNRLQNVVSRVQEMTSALTDGVISINTRGNIEWWNSAAGRLLEFRETDRGHKITNFIRAPRFVKYYESENFDEPLVIQSSRREGLHLQIQVHPFGQGEKLVVVRDISRVFRLEQMRKDFVANVSHELRTPLTVVRGYLETLGDSPNVPPVWVKAIDQMQQQVQRMSALVNDLITLTKLETDDRETHNEEVNIAQLVKTILSDAKVLSGDKNHIFHQTGDAALSLHGSERELRSAFSNLIFNAVHYSPSKAEISVEYRVVGNEVVVQVTDTGSGIDPKHIPRLTERFYRVDSARSIATGGTGLGLAIVKHVLLRHEAELKITSKLGVGSKFSCHFPLHRHLLEPSNAA